MRIMPTGYVKNQALRKTESIISCFLPIIQEWTVSLSLVLLRIKQGNVNIFKK